MEPGTWCLGPTEVASMLRRNSSDVQVYTRATPRCCEQAAYILGRGTGPCKLLLRQVPVPRAVESHVANQGNDQSVPSCTSPLISTLAGYPIVKIRTLFRVY